MWGDAFCFQYPYENALQQAALIASSGDFYKRSPPRLFWSCAKLGEKILGRDVESSMDITDVELSIRVCEDRITNLDFDRLCKKIPPSVDSMIVSSDWFSSPESIKEMPQLSSCSRVVFPRCLEDKYSLFLVSSPVGAVDGYFIGNWSADQIQEHGRTSFAKIEQIFDSSALEYRVRLQVSAPELFASNPGILALILAIQLHRRGAYLDLPKEKYHRYKFTLIKNLKAFHDSWLGRLDIEGLQKERRLFPFVTFDHQHEDLSIHEVRELGWMLIDVTGDGNCGYYSTVLGMANISKGKGSLLSEQFGTSMKTKGQWQTVIVELRTKLQEQSHKLLKTFPLGKQPEEWANLMGVTSDADMASKSNFLNAKLRPKEYFQEPFLDDTEHHMDPFWGSYVLASLYRLRVVLVLRNTENGSSSALNPYTWSTTIFEYTTPMVSRKKAPKLQHVKITRHDGLHRISDESFRNKDTIELFFRTGYLSDNAPDEQHFEYLRRVLCDDVPILEDPSPEAILGMAITQPQESIRTSLFREGDPDTGNGPKRRDAPAQATESKRQKVADRAQFLDPPEDLSPEVLPASNDGTVDVHEDTPHDIKQTVNLSAGATTTAASDVTGGNSTDNTNSGTSPSHSASVRSDHSGKETPPPAGGNIDAPADDLPATLDEDFFDARFHNGESAHKFAARMKWDAKKNQFYTTTIDPKRNTFGDAILQESVATFDPLLVQAARHRPGQWVGCSLGAPGDGDAPDYLVTSVPTIYQQHGRSFCLTYSLASALFYCGFKEPAYCLAQQAEIFSVLDIDLALFRLKAFMLDIVPEIGKPTLYGRRSVQSRGAPRRVLSWEELFDSPVPYPTIVIPVLPNGTLSHALCVVDDLIFDSTTPFALKLQRESVQWLLNDSMAGIFLAVRFNMKYSPPNHDVTSEYSRTVTLHWANLREAPPSLRSPVKTPYRHHNQRFRLTYSLASALDYCGFKGLASVLSQSAGVLSMMPPDAALSKLEALLTIHLPAIQGLEPIESCLIGLDENPRVQLWDELCQELTSDPILAIPKTSDGSPVHAFCVVNDLIFDSSTVFALQLCREALMWTLEGALVETYQLLRFHR
jgi:hypothetical protein